MAKLKVRARTVDMLGRQQIAGIPSAIHELFKNAHDAYAKRVEVDYFHHNDLFIVRDDGIGMTREEFESRWLTLGTESKLGQGGLVPPERPQGMRARPILGEKGVGRLAIAAIGPQVLVATRSYRERSKIVVAFLNWRFFELPGIDLDEIEIPVEVVSVPEYRKGQFVKRLVDLTRKQVKSLGSKSESKLLGQIAAQLDQIDLKPSEYDGFFDGPSLVQERHGTHFFVFPADPIIRDELSVEKDELTASPLDKFLLGFSDAWTPRTANPPITSAFREHRSDATTFDLTGSDRFFTASDFDSADHIIDGSFDKYGNFVGTVGIYGQKPKKVSYKWNVWKGFTGKKTRCGPVSITFGYVQGKASESRLPVSIHGAINKKLKRFGGLYVYRDRLRVLPYGDSDFDFLDVEKRRNLGAGYYFYSYRRMFGAINITQKHNPQLVEKAGREGFRQNKAYFEFQSLLIGLLLKTAQDFFRETGEFSETFFPIKKELSRKARLEKQRAAYAKKARRTLERGIDSFFRKIARGDPSQTVVALEQSMKRLLTDLSETKKQNLNAAALVTEKEFSRILASSKNEYKVSIPSDVGLGKKLERECDAYLREYSKLQKEVFDPLRKKFQELFETALKDAKARKSINRRMIGQELLEHSLSVSSQKVDEQERLAFSENTALKRFFEESVRKITGAFSKDSAAVIKDYLARTKGKPTSAKLYRERERATKMLDAIYRDADKGLAELNSSMKSIRAAVSEGGTFSHDLVAALEEKIANQENELEDGLELMQLGTALGIVQHEFINTIQQVRSGIAKLKPWADVNPDLVKLYEAIHQNFEHLSGYLTLFDPLSRRLNPVKVEISGNELLKYLKDFFGARLVRHEVTLTATSTFRSKKVRGYTSTFYPAFVNLIDNAIYWLANYTEDSRRILLDANARGFLVKDNGPGVEPRYRDAIFDFGFTRKTVGRGMGLHISREVLRKENYDLVLLSSEEGEGASFLIDLSREGVK